MLADDEVGTALLRELEARGHADLVVYGTSMLPFIWPGARVRVERAGPGQLNCGEVAVLRSPAGIVAHRVRRTKPLTIRGDAFDHDDALERLEIIGRIRGVVLGRREIALPAPWAARCNRLLLRLVPVARAARPVWMHAGRLLIELRSFADGRLAGSRSGPIVVRYASREDSDAIARCLRAAGQRATRARVDALAQDRTLVAVCPRRGIVGLASFGQEDVSRMRVTELLAVRGSRRVVRAALVAAIDAAHPRL